MPQSPLRVLQLGPYPPPHGGVAANMMAIRHYLREKGHRAGVINLTGHHQPDADEVWFPRSATKLLRLAFTLPYQILHLHVGGAFPMRLVALSMALVSVPGKRSVFTFHSGGYPSSAEGRGASRFTSRGFVFRRFDRIISVNQELIDMFRRFGVGEEKLRLILPFALPVEPPAAALTEPLAGFFACHSPVIITVGQLEPEYDLGRQIDAFAVVRDRFPQAGLVVIGSGSKEVPLRAQQYSKSYRDHVLICGDVRHQVTLRAVSQSSLMWRTTLYDGDAVSVREALHLRVPVIATDNGMRPENTIVVPVGDTERLLAATWRALEQGSPPAASGQSRTGVENMEQTMAVYRELVAET